MAKLDFKDTATKMGGAALGFAVSGFATSLVQKALAPAPTASIAGVDIKSLLGAVLPGLLVGFGASWLADTQRGTVRDLAVPASYVGFGIAGAALLKRLLPGQFAGYFQVANAGGVYRPSAFVPPAGYRQNYSAMRRGATTAYPSNYYSGGPKPTGGHPMAGHPGLSIRMGSRAI